MSLTTPDAVTDVERDSTGQRLVVGVDGSPGAEQALRWALREAGIWAQAAGPHEVLAALAFGPLGRPPKLDALPFGDPVEELVPAAQSLVREAVAVPLAEVPVQVGVSTTAVYDEPTEGLLDLLRPSDLLVLGSRGWGRFRRVLLGSVATRCLQEHRGTVVVVRGDVPVHDDRPVLVGVDGTPDSLTALRWAARFARSRGVPLRVVGAWPSPTSMHPSLRSVIDREREILHAEAELRSLVRTTVADIAGSDGWRPTTDVVDESPVATLTAAAGAGVQLLVVGRGGPTALRHRPIGSTALSCALNATTTVAVVAAAEPTPSPDGPRARAPHSEESP